jgi:hypothetical protein
MTMRIGGTLAPYAGTLPPSISCKLFSFLCLAAALGSLQLPDQPHSALKKNCQIGETNLWLVAATPAMNDVPLLTQRAR